MKNILVLSLLMLVSTSGLAELSVIKPETTLPSPDGALELKDLRPVYARPFVQKELPSARVAVGPHKPTEKKPGVENTPSPQQEQEEITRLMTEPPPVDG